MNFIADKVVDLKEETRTQKQLSLISVLSLSFGFLTVLSFGVVSALYPEIWSKLFQTMAVPKAVLLSSFITAFLLDAAVRLRKSAYRPVTDQEMKDIVEVTRRNPELREMTSLIEKQNRRPLKKEHERMIAYDVSSIATNGFA